MTANVNEKALKKQLENYGNMAYEAEVYDTLNKIIKNFKTIFNVKLSENTLILKQQENEEAQKYAARIMAFGRKLKQLANVLGRYYDNPSETGTFRKIANPFNKCFLRREDRNDDFFTINYFRDYSKEHYITRIISKAENSCSMNFNSDFNFQLLIAVGLASTASALLLLAVAAGVIGTMALVSGAGPLLLLAGATIAGFVLTMHVLGIASVTGGAVLGVASAATVAVGVTGFLKTKGLFPFSEQAVIATAQGTDLSAFS